MLNLFDSDCYVSSLYLCVKFSCEFMPIRRKFERIVCLNMNLPKFPLFSMGGSFFKGKHLFHFVVSDQNRVFNPRAFCSNSFLKGFEHRNFMLHAFINDF